MVYVGYTFRRSGGLDPNEIHNEGGIHLETFGFPTNCRKQLEETTGGGSVS
jgi:hypothetical protein